MSRPLLYVAGRVPARVEAELCASFDLSDQLEGVDGLLTTVNTTVDADYLDRAGRQLRIVANYGAGTNNIDLVAASERHVVVTNTPDVLTDATAELTVGLMLALLRRINEGDRLIRSGRHWTFDLEFMLGESLHGKTVAIIGAGRIGTATARLLAAFSAQPMMVRRSDSLEVALAAADLVSLHCPLTAGTLHLIDRPQFEAMKPTACLINTARGAIVNEGALIAALCAGSIAGAALDVYEFEPNVSERLLKLDNVVLTPHLGSATRATREAMGMVAVSALRDLLTLGKMPATVVSPSYPSLASS